MDRAEMNSEWWTLDKVSHLGFFEFKDIDLLYLFNLDKRTIHEKMYFQFKSTNFQRIFT